MTSKNTKRERLLNWIRNGDPEDVPVLFYPGFSVAASYLGKDIAEVTWAEAIRVAEVTGTHNISIVSSPMPFQAIPFLDDIKMTELRGSLPDGTPRLTTRLETPEGTLTSVQEFPADKGSCHRKFFVNDEQDLSAFAYFIRRTTQEVHTNPAVAERVRQEIQTGVEKGQGVFPSSIWLFCPAVELMSSYYMDQQTALYTVYDHRELMEELMDCHWQMTEVWLALVAKSDVDVCQYAINGFEWLNPDLYRRYMIPQAQRINESVASAGKLSWIHTCGKMKRLAGMKVYQEMGVDVVESLSLPPAGDVDNLAATRADIGTEIATRGGIPIDFLYRSDVDAVRKCTEYVLESVSGYRHMVGDSDGSYPPYPWRNIAAVIDAVRDRGQLYE